LPPPPGAPSILGPSDLLHPLRAALLLVATICCLWSSEPKPTQPILLPIADLLKQLDRTQDYVLLPLGQYRELIAAGRRPTAAAKRPEAVLAWIESARVSGRLDGERVLRWSAELVAVSTAAGSARCPLFAKRPAYLHPAGLDGGEALYAPLTGEGIDLLLPTPGRFRVHLAWDAVLVERERAFVGEVPLPLAGAIDLALRGAGDGRFAAPGLASVGEGTWRSTGALPATLAVSWLPGADAAAQAAVFAAEQAVHVVLIPGARTFRWVARLSARRGRVPESIDLALPAGWTATAPGAGVLAVTPLPAGGGVRLRLAAGTPHVVLDGFLTDAAGIDLPSLVGAAYQPGVITLTVAHDQPVDWTPPSAWRAVPLAESAGVGGNATLRAFAVPAPGTPLIATLASAASVVDLATSTTVAFGPERWRLEAFLRLRLGTAPRFRLPLTLPTGWTLRALDVRVAGVPVAVALPDDAVEEIVIELPGGGAGATVEALIAAERPAGDQLDLLPPRIAGVDRAQHRLALIAAPGVELAVTAGAWRLADGDGGAAVELCATGTVAAVGVRARPRPFSGDAEAVLYLLPTAPGAGGEGWARLDLRLRTRDREVESLELRSPFIADRELRLTGVSGVSATWLPVAEAGAAPTAPQVEGRRLRLTFPSPWIGERRLRLEGPVPASLLGDLVAARVTIAGLAMKQILAVQAGPEHDLRLDAGVGALTIEDDALPLWSQPLPGLAVVGAWRLGDGAIGTLTVGDRRLAAGAAGFIDRIEYRWQVDATATWLLARGAVVAPGRSALPIAVPPGYTLIDATVDGLPVALRRDAGADVLPLPGRTRVAVAMRFLRSGAPDGALVPPGFGDLAVTAAQWRVAVGSGLVARPLVASDALTLRPLDSVPRWRLLAGWEAPVERLIAETTPPTPVAATADDPRVLRPVTPPPPPPRGEPRLALSGQQFTATTGGEALPARLVIVRRDDQRSAGAWGRVLGLIAALAVALLLSWRSQGLLLVAALSALFALHVRGGDTLWLAALETAVVAGLLLAPLLALSRRLRTTRTLAPLLLLVALAPGAMAAERQPVLMGYERLGPDGLPQEVVVALTRARLDQLWKRAHPEAEPIAPAVDLATGAARYRLRLVGDTVSGELELPLAVLAATWQQVRLPVRPGSLRDVGVLPLHEPALGGGTPAGSATARPVAWTIAGEVLTVTLAPRQQCRLRIGLDLAVEALAGGGGALRLPVLPGSGGSLELALPAEWDLTIDGHDRALPRRLAGTPGTDGPTWLVALPAGAAEVAVRWQPPAAAARVEASLTVEQAVEVRLTDGRLEWRATLDLALRGRPLRELGVDLPPGLVLTAAEGPALSGWQQQGATANLVWTTAQEGRARAVLAGFIPRAVQGSAAVLATVRGAARSSGRLALRHGVDARFAMPQASGVERAAAAADEDLALRWVEAPAGLAVAWDRPTGDLRADSRIAVIAGRDRVRLVAITTLRGRGESDALAFAVPAPWRLAPVTTVATAGDQTLVFTGSGTTRRLVARAAQPWSEGATVTIAIEAERGAVLATEGGLTLPDPTPLSGAAPGTQDWLVGDAGDRQAVVDLAGHASAKTATIAPAFTGVLAAGEQWRQALVRRPGSPLPRLRLVAEPVQVQVSASHWLVLDTERVRWSARLLCTPLRGEMDAVALTLPAGAVLRRVRCADVAGHEITDGVLRVRLAAPTRRRVAIDLDLEVPLARGAVRLTAAGLSAGLVPGAQSVVLVESDQDGLTVLDADGLDAVSAGDLATLAAGVPAGVTPGAVRSAWRAARPDWTLSVRREALAADAAGDGIVTLVDGLTRLGRDGGERGRATWHVLNRRRQHLTLSVPDDVQVWEVRVDGAVVRPRLDSVAGRLLVPVRPLHTGEPATRVQLTWARAARPANLAGGRFAPAIPRLDGLTVTEVLWRVLPPEGWTVERRDGALRETAAGDAEAGRARRVLEELQRLKGQDATMPESAARRLAGELAVLDVELSDYLVGLRRRGDDELAGRAQRAREEIGARLAAVEDGLAKARARRAALGLDRELMDWPALPAAAGPGSDYLPRLKPVLTPWRVPEAGAAIANLGAGQPPPGQRAEAGALHGIDLLGGADAGGLPLRSSGGLDVELVLKAPAAPWWPTVVLVFATIIAIGGLMLARRR